MRKPVYAICEQQRRRSACESSTFVVRCHDSVISLVSISEISSLYLASVAEQASLSLSWSQTQKTGYLATRLICITISTICHKAPATGLLKAKTSVSNQKVLRTLLSVCCKLHRLSQTILYVNIFKLGKWRFSLSFVTNI